jgi:FkbM family methyltransferase
MTSLQQSQAMPYGLAAFARLTRRLAGVRGLDRLIRRVHSPDRPPGAGIRTVVPYGDHSLFYVDTANFIEWSVFFKGHFGRGIAALISRLLKPGMVAVDVGANNGTETILMSEAVGLHGRVVAVEPGAAARARLRRNLELNHCANVTIVDRCLGRSAGEDAFLLLSTTSNPTATSAVGTKPAAAGGVHVIDAGATTTVDAIIADAGVERVDLVKIDTDGNELDVLFGASLTLAAHHPAVIFEFDPSHYAAHGKAWGDVYDLMTGLGYELHGIPASGLPKNRSLTATAPAAADILAMWRPC